MSRTARTPTTAIPETRTRSRAIAQAAERALHPPLAPEPEPARDETAEQDRASEETEEAVGAVEDAAPTEPEQPPEPPQGAPVRAGVLHSRHDVERAMAEVRQMVAAFGRRGVRVKIDALDLATLRPRAQAFAACRLLVMKGLATQEEVQFEEAMVLRDMLGMIYQAFEERELAERRPVVATRGDIIVPGRQ